MDDMEASVPENGRFFIKLGEKTYDSNDNRVIILHEGGKTAEGKFEYAVITDRGPMKLTLDKELDESEILANRRSFRGVLVLDSSSTQGDNLIVKSKLDFTNSNYGTQLELLPIGEADQNFLSEAITKSIEKSRATSENATNKAALEAEEIKQTVAKGLSDLFSRAIQPPIGKGPASPPPASTPTA